MIPQPITINGRTGTVLYVDADWHPVPPEQATMAQVLFDDGGSAFYMAEPTVVEKFDEAKHPRDKEGQFTESKQLQGDEEDARIFFHGTAEARLADILRQGLLVGHAGEVWPDFSHRDSVYMTDDEDDAQRWARLTAERAMFGRTTAQQPEDVVPDVAILTIRIPDEYVPVLKPDENFDPDTHARQFKGNIPPSWIIGVKVGIINEDEDEFEWHEVPLKKAAADGKIIYVVVVLQSSAEKQPGVGGITKKFDEAKHPRGEDGRFKEATQPRIFNRPSEVEQYSSWGETRWQWKSKPGLLLTGEPIPREQLPETLYHVTTNAPAVESSGVLLGLQEMGGLGGGQAEGVSFTSSKEDATVIQRELKRAVQIANGMANEKVFNFYARADEEEARLPKGSLQYAADQALQTWESNKFSIEHTYVPGQGYTGPPHPPEEYERLRLSILKDAFNSYLWARETASEKAAGQKVPLLKNPILFGQQEHLARLDPANVQILEVPSAQIPAEALVTTGSDKFLHEVRAYSDVPIIQRKKKREYVREPAGTSEGGQFAETAMVAPILKGVDSKANAAAQIEWHHQFSKAVGSDLTVADEKAAEEELRALPLIHGTSVAGAIGAIEDGLLSHKAMEGQKKELLGEIDDIKDSINNIVGDRVKNLDMYDVTYWTGDDIANLGLDRHDTEALKGYVQELRDVQIVLTGTTNHADEVLGLDQFVFMSHGAKHPDYGNVSVVIDNEVLQKGFVTEKDIAMVANTVFHEEYDPVGVKKYQSMIVKGDDYYAVAAAKAGSPDSLPYRSRDQLFEIKVPHVPPSEVKGFMVESDLEAAQRLADKLAVHHRKNQVLYMDEVYGNDAHEFLHHQLKAMQTTGMWDEDAVSQFKEKHDGTGVYIL